MIDISNEQVISLSRACELPALRRGGKPPVFSTILRWTQHGIRGEVLESVRIGNTICTSIEAIERWIARLSGNQPQPTPTQKQRAADALRELERMGV